MPFFKYVIFLEFTPEALNFHRKLDVVLGAVNSIQRNPITYVIAAHVSLV